MLCQVNDEIYKLVKEHNKESIDLFNKTVTYLKQIKSRLTVSYISSYNEYKNKIKFDYFHSPKNVIKEIWRNIFLLTWTKHFVEKECHKEIEDLKKKGKDLIDLIKNTDHKPVTIIMHESKEAYEKYLKELENDKNN